MFKKNLVPFSILLILAGIAAYYFISQKSSTLNKEEVAFIIKDTAAIDKIEIKNKLDTFIIQRNSGWVIDHKYPASEAMMGLCFKIFTEAQIQSALSSKLAEEASKLLEKEGAKIQVLFKDGSRKELMIFPNRETKQVFMMVEGETPFIVNLPSYDGNFAALFFMKANVWRSRTVLYFNKNTSFIEVSFFQKQYKSYKIDFSENNPKLLNYQGKSLAYDPESMKQYLFGLKSLKIENYLYNQKSVDSIKSAKPLIQLNVGNRNSNITKVLVYPKGQPADLNECYFLINKTELAASKYVYLDAVAPEIDLFLTK